MGKCPKCGKKTTSWLELEYCDMCYTEDELNPYKLLDEIDWLKQKIFRIQYDCDQCQARHIKDKDDLEAKLAESEKRNKELVKALNGEVFINYKVPMENAQLKQQLAEKDLRIEELEGQFGYECECNAQFVDCQKENEGLKQQLAEKEKEIDKLEDKLHHYYEETLNKGICGLCDHLRGEYKADFAIAQLEKAKELCIKDMTICEDYFAIEHILDKQIKELKEKTNVKN